jgi:hypothetical protein
VRSRSGQLRHGLTAVGLGVGVGGLTLSDDGVSWVRLVLALGLCTMAFAVGLTAGAQWRQVLRDQRDWHRLAAEARLEAAGAALQAADRLGRHLDRMIARPRIAVRAHSLRQRRARRGWST